MWCAFNASPVYITCKVVTLILGPMTEAPHYKVEDNIVGPRLRSRAYTRFIYRGVVEDSQNWWKCIMCIGICSTYIQWVFFVCMFVLAAATASADKHVKWSCTGHTALHVFCRPV